MSRQPYLHPNQRNFSTEQVGPSTHQNSYNKGVLLGNWFEDRMPPSSVAAHEWPQSTAKGDFTKKMVRPRDMMVPPDLGRQLLFDQQSGHGLPSKKVDSLQKKQSEWKKQNDPDGGFAFSRK